MSDSTSISPPPPPPPSPAAPQGNFAVIFPLSILAETTGVLVNFLQQYCLRIETTEVMVRGGDPTINPTELQHRVILGAHVEQVEQLPWQDWFDEMVPDVMNAGRRDRLYQRLRRARSRVHGLFRRAE
ncbi:hypothetical protein E6O75_ATG03933 [Venturia nashicola]|uniref:Uncharacterized protein n=1 Tax=Venturia nashicola TaxID=86259 RepID=A0A4Z1PQ63_9PEZI|nr:hypothetical protein E6O75_ATG03933 [Venturia nashicola]